ncbi:regulatory protein [Cyclobacterium lianum]|uniref:Regulatory protein RecX n=1 Tax=Cyclobacterium lianum TaxID=388280 RepID=A0A1M7IIG5_9BACT|nr:regulatory protein RecX [Cyclobacterium lianum]SHM40227.1 regulatory protein [Cyclobacterium lianum]
MSVPEKENSDTGAKKKPGYAAALRRIASFCAYQERSHFEVRGKLEDWGLGPEEIGKLIARLEEQDFLNEKRFVDSFVRGRFGLKKWGKIRIRQELKMRQISEDLIRDSLAALDESEYEETLRFLAERKWKLTNEADPYKKKAKVSRFLLFRGFEADLIKDVVDGLATV